MSNLEGVTTPAIEAKLPMLDAAHDRLLATVERLNDQQLAESSRLPGWTRAHVLAHLCGNATAMGRLAGWAVTGIEQPAYVSREARDAEIEELATLPAAELKAMVAETAERFRTVLTLVSGTASRRPLKSAAGQSVTALDLPRLRQREVEIHHVDLDAGAEIEDWPGVFAAETLDDLSYRIRNGSGQPGVKNLRATDTLGTWVLGTTGVELRGPVRLLLAWLAGRSNGADLTVEPHGPIPSPPPWG